MARLFADQAAAVSSANARQGFREINTLRAALKKGKHYLRAEVNEEVGGLAGQSPAPGMILSQMKLVAPTEGGADTRRIGHGKELIHELSTTDSSRSRATLVKGGGFPPPNCGSIPRERSSKARVFGSLGARSPARMRRPRGSDFNLLTVDSYSSIDEVGRNFRRIAVQAVSVCRKANLSASGGMYPQS